VPLPGVHQALNCGLALAIAAQLHERGCVIDSERCVEGLTNTMIRGRMELVLTSPAVMIDGAHNAASIAALFDAVRAHVHCDSLIVIFGCAQDKDIDGMLSLVATRADKAIFTRAAGNPWAASPEMLAERYVELGGRMHQIAPTFSAAFERASQPVTPDDLILVTGSFYLAGEARQLLLPDADQTDTNEDHATEIGVRRLSPLARLAQFRRR
jgi:dihydrofolate synthase/folylpolyglutamate synthase